MENKKNWFEILPSWIQALGIIGLFFLVLDRIELNYKDEVKSQILATLTKNEIPLSKIELFKGMRFNQSDSGFLASFGSLGFKFLQDDTNSEELATVALYELMADGVILKTAVGWELTRHEKRCGCYRDC